MAKKSKVEEHTYIKPCLPFLLLYPLPSQTQNPRKRMRSVHCVQPRDKAPSAEERPGWLSGPSCFTLSPGGGWARNTGRVRGGSQRKGEGGKTFNRPPPSRHSSSIFPCLMWPVEGQSEETCQGAKTQKPTDLVRVHQANREDGKASWKFWGKVLCVTDFLEWFCRGFRTTICLNASRSEYEDINSQMYKKSFKRHTILYFLQTIFSAT